MRNLLVLVMILFLASCDFLSLMNAGTHGSLGGYSFNISKDSLEKTINLLLNNNVKITEFDKEENGIYRTILIVSNDSCYFVFRFYGDEEIWKLNPNNSEIFIASVKIGNDKYKHQGEISNKEQKRILSIFEKNFINPLRQLLEKK